MPRLIPEPVQAQLTGLQNMTAHARRLFQQGIYDRDDVYKAEAYEAEQRGHIADAETFAAMRKDGTWDKLEQVLRDPRSGTPAERELIARKTAAHYVAEQALGYQPRSQAEHNEVMAQTRKRMAEFVDLSGADVDDDFAIFETKAKLDLGDEVKAPKPEDPSWAKPVQRISDDDADAKSFRLRDENTFGTKRYNEAHDTAGVKRAANGRIISEKTLREDADKPKPKKSEYDDTRGYTVDHEIGVVSSGEMEAIQKYEFDRHNDAVAAVEANPLEYMGDPGPVTLPNPE